MERPTKDKFEFDRFAWIRELAKIEQQMEESGVVDAHFAQDFERRLSLETHQLIQKIREEITEYATLFNEYKNSPVGRLKIYGIANTYVDFMLFRNGYKMVFSAKSPGVISIRFNFLAPSGNLVALPSGGIQATNGPAMEEILLEAKPGAFEAIHWFTQDQKVEKSEVAKYHFTLFVRESSR